jgi:C1A family cysteine protease
MKTTYNKPILDGANEPIGTGWLPPKPDLRDYTCISKEIRTINKKLNLSDEKPKKGASADLRQWCSPVENQGTLGSCTAHAGIGVVEYYERRAFNKHIEGSRLFLYKATRNLMQVKGDTGGWLRDVMKALVLCGVPDEKYWPYKIADFDKEPDAFIYSIAENYAALKYFCHDAQGAAISETGILFSVKKYLDAGIPSMFGFWGFPSYKDSDVPGGIPYPGPGEKAEWGHAVVAVGYDDEKKIKNLKSNKTTTGAFLFRNSWGPQWGDKGYGWLPYDYVLFRVAQDFWSMLSMEWLDTGQFGA